MACASSPPPALQATDGIQSVVNVRGPGNVESLYPVSLGKAGRFSVFEPAPDDTQKSIDYDVISEALELVVLNTGPSTRLRARNVIENRTGSRIQKGHQSPYRLEGNKLILSFFDEETKAAFREYADSLEEIGNQTDISSLSRNEQLAYWLNLHNLLVIATIAEEYPVQNPSRLKVGLDGETLHEAKLVTIKGVPLSLADIRQQIVYRYWNDPRVMYGFFHGDLGSPNITREAYTVSNVGDLLDRNAREFVNSLRGVSNGQGAVLISRHYYEARAGLFPNWPDDLRAHLEQFARKEVVEILIANEAFRPLPYPDDIADIVGGDIGVDYLARGSMPPIKDRRPNERMRTPSMEKSPYGSATTPPGFGQMMGELQDKYKELRRQGRIGKGRAIIIDNPDAYGDPGEEEDDELE